MRLAVVVRARSYLRTLGPILSAALRRGWRVRVVTPPTALKSPEDKIRREELESFWPGAWPGSSLTATDFGDVDAMIGLNQGMAGVARASPVILVDPTFDAWLAPPQKDMRQAYANPYHLRIHTELYPGAPVVEPIRAGWVNGDWWLNSILPAQRTIAVFFSLKLNVPGRGRWGWDGLRAYRKAAEQARDVARAHGWTFVVKGREKNGDPRWLKKLGEYVTDREHPYESMRLLSRAAWAIHYAPSGVGRESALLGVPQTVLVVPTPHLDHLPGHAERMNMLEAGRWPGVISDRLMPFTLDEAQRRAWVSQYLGVQDGRCSERVLDAL